MHVPPSNVVVVRSYPIRSYSRLNPVDGTGWIWVVIVAAIVASLIAGCSPPRLPPPDARGTIRELDRIETALWEHPLTYWQWRASR